MSPSAAACLIAITELVFKYGVSAAMRIIKEWDVEKPTAQDFQALAAMVRKPEEYFENEVVGK